MKKPAPRLTYANVMSTIAVFLAIGGGSFAVAAALKKNSVGTKQIAANAVKTAEIANNAVKTAKIAVGSITTDRLADNAVTGAKVVEASLGEVPLAAVATRADNVVGAFVASGGELSSSTEPGTASSRTGTGLYRLTYNRNLGSCSVVASLGNNAAAIPNPGEIGATINGLDDSVQVQTRNSAGTPVDNGFGVILAC